MDRAPAIELKALDACQVGELVRFTDDETLRVGLIAERLDTRGRFLVVLNDPEYNGWPSYRSLQHSHQSVLSYGNRYQIAVDQKQFELPPTTLMRKPGILYLHGSDWQTKALPERGSQSFASLHVSLLSGALLTVPSINEIAAFPRWSLVTAELSVAPAEGKSIYEIFSPAPNAS